MKPNQTYSLSDLVENPYKIDVKLERGIVEWEEAIGEYKLFESSCLDDPVTGDELKAILPMLRADPSQFVAYESSMDNPADNIRKLAEMKQRVNSMLFQLGLAKKPSTSAAEMATALDAEPSARNPMHPDPDPDPEDRPSPPLHHTVVSTISSISSTVSTIWANRLNAINPTQGRLEMAHKKHSPSLSHGPMKVKPKWPDFLVDTSYDVIKVNKFGQKMRRTIKLTQHHVISIKNGCEVTKFYAFSDVRVIWLEHQDTIRIQQRSGKMNVYMSPIAPHILQQITTRVKVRAALDKAEISDSPLASLGYSPDVISGIIKSISEDNATEAEQVVALFANDLRERTVRTLSMDDRQSRQSQDVAGPLTALRSLDSLGDGDGDGDGETEATRSGEDVCEQGSSVIAALLEDMVRTVEAGLRQDRGAFDAAREADAWNAGEQLGSSSSAGGPRLAADEKLSPSAAAAATSSHPNPKFVSFKEGMPEYTVQKKVRGIIFDDASPEGNTRKIFVESFVAPVSATSSSRLLDLRHFIDGMHSHFIEHRGTALCLLYEQERQSFLINSPKFSEMGNLDFLRVLDSKTRDAAASKYRLDSKAAAVAASYSLFKEKLLLAEVDERVLAFVSFVVFMVVEEAMFLPLKEEIYKLLPSFGNESEERALVEKMRTFKKRSQAQWGVPPDLVSPLCWQSAVFELAGVELNLTPSTQLHILTRTIKAIYSEFKLVVLPHLQAKGNYEVYISADDLVPIFMFVFCQSDLRHPIKNRELMWSLCHPDQLQGEAGYYLTVYESSIEFILHEPVTSAAFTSPPANSLFSSLTAAAPPPAMDQQPHGPGSSSSSSSGAIDISKIPRKREPEPEPEPGSPASSKSQAAATRSIFWHASVALGMSKKMPSKERSKNQNASMRESFSSDTTS
eukprot:gene29592-38714_t